MAFDISSITSAVNKYLYSMSDVNKYLTQQSSDTESQSALSGLFEKYLTKAVQDNITGSGTELSSNEITSALLTLGNGVTADKTAIDSIGTKNNMSDEEVSKALSSLKGLSAGLSTDDSNSASNLDSAFSSSLPDLTGLNALSKSSSLVSLLTLLQDVSGSEANVSDEVSEATAKELAAAIKAAYANKSQQDSSVSAANAKTSSAKSNNEIENSIAEQMKSTFTSLNLEAEIKGAFSGMDNMAQQIQSKIANRDITGEINKSIDNLDIKGDIERSIASHDRSDEINEYNATKLKNYKKQTSDTSVFGDYRL